MALKLDLTNPSTGKQVSAYTDIIGDGISLKTHYLSVEYFTQLMCDLGYKKTVHTKYNQDATILLAGKLTEDDQKFKDSNLIVWQALQSLNNSWVEIYKRTKEGYYTGNMENDVLELMDIVREVGNKSKITEKGITDRVV